jgi:hypothetical protein
MYCNKSTVLKGMQMISYHQYTVLRGTVCKRDITMDYKDCKIVIAMNRPFY